MSESPRRRLENLLDRPVSYHRCLENEGDGLPEFSGIVQKGSPLEEFLPVGTRAI